MKAEVFRCDICGRFVSLSDLISGKASTKMVTPDTHFTAEEFETLCPKCKEKETHDHS